MRNIACSPPTNRLIECLGVQMPAAARGRPDGARYRVNPIPPADLLENSMPRRRWVRPCRSAGRRAGATPGETMANPTARRRAGKESEDG